MSATPEDLLPTGTSEPTPLSSRQKMLVDALRREDPRLASMYLGAILVLNQRENPERTVFAAHSARELMEKFPRYRDVPTPVQPTQQPSLLSQARNLAEVWTAMIRNSSCAKARWSGEIDGPLARFLAKAESFFAWLAKLASVQLALRE